MRNQWIRKCLDSLYASMHPVQIFAVDNASTDDSVKFILENYPDVHLVLSKENLGFGGANNLAIKEALQKGAEYFLLINQDAYVEADTVGNLVEAAQGAKEFGIVSPMHLNGDGSALDFSFSKSIAPHLCPNLYSDFVLGKVKNEVYSAAFICAAAWLITKECLRIVGGFSPTFFHYAEDDDYVNRLHYKGLKIGVIPTAKIFHDRHERPAHETFDSWSYKEKNRLLLEISNPDRKLTVDGALRFLGISTIKSMLKGDKEKSIFYRNTRKELLKNGGFISRNASLTLGQEEFLFLK